MFYASFEDGRVCAEHAPERVWLGYGKVGLELPEIFEDLVTRTLSQECNDRSGLGLLIA